MTTESDKFHGLYEIAAQIEPFEKAWFDAFEQILTPGTRKTGAQEWAELVEATRVLNEAIEPHIDMVATITENNPSTIRQVFCTKKDDGSGNIDAYFGGNPAHRGWGPSEFLRCVADYKSFNTNYWISKVGRNDLGGFLKERIEKRNLSTAGKPD